MEPFLAQIMLFAGNFAPRGWAFCEGQLLPIAQNTALFSLMGTIYGGDGRTTFALPDLRGRVPIGPGTGPGLPNHTLGERAGTNSTTLLSANLPVHGHTVSLRAKEEGNTDSPTAAFIAGNGTNSFGTNPDVDMAPINTSNVGSGQPFNNMQPYLAMHYCIALVGIFPSRN